jgi:cellulose synthase/poly-beta-1,6-N-acetylglucosamine synthase-like glycosyltransferase
MELNKLITIVIPCKNEKDIILKTLDLLNYQVDIHNVKVIVCDASNDGVTKPSLWDRLEYDSNTDMFDLHLTDGGLPAKARNNGFKLVTTPYVLFMDADVFLLDPKVLKRSVLRIHKNRLDLVTTKFRSDNGKYNYVYKVFDLIQGLSKWSTPFCLGGYMLVRSETFKSIGGFDEEVKVAEDYMISKQIKRDKFKIHKSIVFTSPRRFQSKGLWYMLKLMIGSFFNKNNKKYFEEDKDYWI